MSERHKQLTLSLSQVQTISLAHNGLGSAIFITTLSHYLPRLANLSLEDNNLRVWKDLDYISGRRGKLEHLRELILKGNPIRELEYQNNRVEKYKTCVMPVVFRSGSEPFFFSEVARRFPSLEMLDQEPVVKIAFDVPLASTSASVPSKLRSGSSSFPSDMMPSFVTGVDGNLISNFLMQ